jgi:flagellin
MTRINTNVPSLVAQNRLQSSNRDLQTALTRLSTGLRINTGADDPAGLIASEALRSEITSLGKAISNTRRASQIISTADSALGQVSSLLNDIRGLVVEAANNGALSQEEIAANQLQIDSSLEAINRIAQTTTFQGRKLLDGSLDFITAAGIGFGTVRDLQIDQASLGSTGSVSVSVQISSAATRASIANTGISPAATAASATATLTLSDIVPDAEASTPAGIPLNLTNTGDLFELAAVDTGAADGTVGNATDIVFQAGASTDAVYDSLNNILTVSVNGADSIANIAAAIDAEGTFVTSNVQAGNYNALDNGTTLSSPLSGGTDATLDDVITVTADDATANINGLTLTLIEDASVSSGTAEASFNGSNIEVRVRNSGNTAIGAIAAAIDGLDGYSAAVTENSGDGIYNATTDTAPAASTFAGGVDGGGLAADIVFQLNGTLGSEVFNFQAGASVDNIVAAVNLVSDATGVQATNDAGALVLTSSIYGSSGLVDIDIISEGAGGTFASALSSQRAIGTDLAATVNGTIANTDGNTLSINTATLDLKLTVSDASSADVNFTITGGGALFQLGPDVVSNQQARLGISSVNTAKLGGVSGRLYELGSGQAKSLTSDAAGGARIIDEVIGKVTSLRGRLGAFQSTTLDSNLVSLNETQSNLLEAESSIRDADFAQESANLTRAQILVQSGTNVLALANQNPQNVLALLR